MKEEISEQYSELLKSPFWIIKRERIMEREMVINVLIVEAHLRWLYIISSTISLRNEMS